jgi:aspartate racemase
MSKQGRCLGLIGGLGPAATVYYYRGLIAAHAKAGFTPRMLIAQADVDAARPMAEANDLDGLARYLNGFVDQLAAGGAEMTAIVAITPHICAAQLVKISKLPLIDMVSEVDTVVRAKGWKRIALFGTKSTVGSKMFGRLGVEVVMPKPDEIERIHNAYLDVVYDRHTSQTLDDLRELAHTLMKRDGAEAVLLAGTDLSTVMNEDNAGFPTLDCAGIHIAAITKKLMA